MLHLRPSKSQEYGTKKGFFILHCQFFILYLTRNRVGWKAGYYKWH
jgi:hypothetical protein